MTPVRWSIYGIFIPRSRYWQSTIADTAGTIAAAHNVSGVYIDETASAYAQICWHKHGSGGGAAWANGNRALLRATEQAIGPNRVVISESNAEAYLGSLHAFLAIYGWQNCRMVPAFQAVYSGWSVNVGTEGFPLETDVNGFRVVLAQQWQLGHVLGWTSPGQLLRVFAAPEVLIFQYVIVNPFVFWLLTKYVKMTGRSLPALAVSAQGSAQQIPGPRPAHAPATGSPSGWCGFPCRAVVWSLLRPCMLRV